MEAVRVSHHALRLHVRRYDYYYSLLALLSLLDKCLATLVIFLPNKKTLYLLNFGFKISGFRIYNEDLNT